MRVNIWLKRLLPPAVIIPLLAIFWNWDWFIPLIDAEASASLGHKVTIQHLHVALGRTATIAATSITIANPSVFPTDEAQLAGIDRMLVNVDVMEFYRTPHPLAHQCRGRPPRRKYPPTS